MAVTIFAFSTFACSNNKHSKSEIPTSDEKEEANDTSEDDFDDEYYEDHDDEESDYYEGFQYTGIEPLSTNIDSEYLLDTSKSMKITFIDTSTTTNNSTMYFAKDLYISVLKLVSYNPDGSEAVSVETSNIYQLDTQTVDYITTYKDSETSETIYFNGGEGFEGYNYTEDEFDYIPNLSSTNASSGGLVTGEDGKTYYCIKYKELYSIDDTLLFDAETKELCYMNSIPVKLEYIDDLTIESYLNSQSSEITTIENFEDYDSQSFSYVDKYLKSAN